MAETPEERRARIQKEVAAASAERKSAYFEAQAKSKAAAEALRPELPAADAYRYSYAWKQDPGAATGEYTLISSPNAYYDPSTNTIFDPATGTRTTATQSMWSGPTTFRATGSTSATSKTSFINPQDVRDPVTGLTPAQLDARKNAEALAKALGAKIDPVTGFIDKSTVTNPFGVYGSAGAKTIISVTYTGAGKDRVKVTEYIDGTKSTEPAPESTIITTASGDGSVSGNAAALAAQQAAEAAAAEKLRQGQSAYALLFSEFERYGLGALVEPLKQFVIEGLSPAEFTLRLRETDAYKKRFAANAQRINKGLRALSEAEYITLEDQYQNVMRNYGLPTSYYQRGDMGIQSGFEKFIAGDVSAAELEDRIQTAQNRVINAAPQVSQALREFYPDISNGDILAYALDPDQALTNIKRKVGAAEIGAGAMQAGLATGLSRAEELQRFGVTGEQARQGYQTIAEFLPSASKLGDIYRKSGMGPYNQVVAEQEVFGITGAADAASKRKKLAQLESAQFSGTSGAAGGALGRERAGQF